MGTNDSMTTNPKPDVTRVGGPDDSRAGKTNDSNIKRPDDSLKEKESTQSEADNLTRNA